MGATSTAYVVALRHGVEDKWLDLELGTLGGTERGGQEVRVRDRPVSQPCLLSPIGPRRPLFRGRIKTTSQTKQERNKALVLEAFDTLFNRRDYVAAEHTGRPNTYPVVGCECDRRRDLNFCWGWLFSRRISNSE